MRCKYCGTRMVASLPVNGRREYFCTTCAAMFREGMLHAEDVWLTPMFEESSWKARKEVREASR